MSESEQDEKTLFAPKVVIPLTRDQNDIVATANSFAVDLFVKDNIINGIGNKCVSPLSETVALMLLANGADGEVYQDLVRGMGLENYSVQEMNSMYQVLLDGLFSADTSATLKLANSVWLSQKPLDSFVEKMKSYSANVDVVDFRDPETRTVVDDWCKSSTDGMINDLTSTIDSFEKLDALLANALYFRGFWTNKFNPADTKQETFLSTTNSRVKKGFMSHKNTYYYGINPDGTECCQIPFGNGAYILNIIMPKKGSDFKEFISSLTYKQIFANNAYMARCKVTLSIPKFTSDYSTDMLSVLRHMNFGSAFSGNSSFTNITEPPLIVVGAHQKTVFSIDEQGGTGASASAFEGLFGASGPPSTPKDVTLTLDHPFVYYLTEWSTKAILFMGMLTE